jgi:two-component system, LuxR family, sensor kinase FixL
MEHLIGDLLYFSRLGRAELAIQDVDLNQIVHDIQDMMDSFLKDHRARIVIPTPMPHIICDKPRITEVLRNLITNAVKYNDKTERVVEVGFIKEAHTDAGPEKNVIYVKDNGIGIAPEFHGAIFRIFKKLQATKEGDKSTGVGLTFVKKIVERHKGRVWLDSEPGKGSTFYFNMGENNKVPT